MGGVTFVRCSVTNVNLFYCTTYEKKQISTDMSTLICDHVLTHRHCPLEASGERASGLTQQLLTENELLVQQFIMLYCAVCQPISMFEM